jgi:phosphonoacetate hydrolase
MANMRHGRDLAHAPMPVGMMHRLQLHARMRISPQNTHVRRRRRPLAASSAPPSPARVALPPPQARGRTVRSQGASPAFGYASVELPPGSRLLPPLQAGDQGISARESKHASRVTRSLLRAGGVQFVAAWLPDIGVYELRGREGAVRWQRYATPSGELVYRIHSIEGSNPIPSGDPRALATLAEEVSAAGGAGKPVPHEATSYPDVLKRLSQIWDSDRAPDLMYIPTGGGDPNHPGAGSHGVLSVTQSRAPLIISGPGVARGVSDELVRSVDIAPTIAEYLGVRPVAGTNATGVPKAQWLKWQDGDSLAPAIANAYEGVRVHGAAQRAMMFVLDGASHTVLMDEVQRGNLPNIAKLMRMGVTFRNGSITDFPTVTWANQNTLTTGASPGHHGLLNNSWYNRSSGLERLVTDGSPTNVLRTGKLMSTQVETIYEAITRSFGRDATTLAINHPSGRGAAISILDLAGFHKLIPHLPNALKRFLRGRSEVQDPRFQGESDYRTASWQDNLGVSIGAAMIARGQAPKLGVFEITLTDNMGHMDGPQAPRTRAALQEADRNIGRIMQELRRRGQFDSTMFVVTADHGMEHSYTTADKLGGWYDAMRRSGVKLVDSTRFVYIKNMMVSVHGEQPRSGVSTPIVVRVANDDTNANGQHFAVGGATVVVSDDAGNSWRAHSDGRGLARLVIAPGIDATRLRVRVDHPSFTQETQEVALVAHPSSRRRRRGTTR